MAAPKKKPAPVPAEKVSQHTLKHAQTRMAQKYKNEPQVEVSISPLYVNEFSRNMPISLNGVRINIPVDGKTYKLPKSFAQEVRSRIYAVDEKTKRLNRMSSVKDNLEQSPGELKLFR